MRPVGRNGYNCKNHSIHNTLLASITSFFTKFIAKYQIPCFSCKYSTWPQCYCFVPAILLGWRTLEIVLNVRKVNLLYLSIKNNSDSMSRRNILFFTGAGISAESGIPTFRDTANGLWNKYDPYHLCSASGFHEDPQTVLDFYNEREGTC